MGNANNLRVGILGTGRMAHAFASGMRHSTEATLVCVGSRSPDSATRFANEFSCSACTGYAAVTGNPSVDLVYIATPHSLHSKHCLMSLNAGKAVLCEKPFAINAAQSAEVIDLARRNDLFLMVIPTMNTPPTIPCFDDPWTLHESVPEVECVVLPLADPRHPLGGEVQTFPLTVDLDPSPQAEKSDDTFRPDLIDEQVGLPVVGESRIEFHDFGLSRWMHSAVPAA